MVVWKLARSFYANYRKYRIYLKIAIVFITFILLIQFLRVYGANLFYGVLLVFFCAVMFAVFCAGDFLDKVAKAARQGNDELENAINAIARFYAFCCVFVYLFGVNVVFYLAMDWIFAPFAVVYLITLICFLYAKIYHIYSIYKKLHRIIAKRQNDGFTLDELYSALGLKGGKFKPFVKNEVKKLEVEGVIVEKDFGGIVVYFESQNFELLAQNIDDFLKKVGKICLCDALEKAKTLIKIKSWVNDTALECFLKDSGNVSKCLIKNEIYLIYNEKQSNFVLCSSCGKEVAKTAHNDTGEWFCSPLCAQTEGLCEKISAQLNPPTEPNETPQSYKARFCRGVSGDVRKAMSELGVPDSWAYLKPISSAEANEKLAAINALPANNANSAADNHANTDNADNADNATPPHAPQSYYKTAINGVNAAFSLANNGEYKYYHGDKPLPLEVPRDQYILALNIMEDKIVQGRVRGIADPRQAASIVKQGGATYEEARAYAKFCAKESLGFDTQSGEVRSHAALGVGFVVENSADYYNNGDVFGVLRRLKDGILLDQNALQHRDNSLVHYIEKLFRAVKDGKISVRLLRTFAVIAIMLFAAVFDAFAGERVVRLIFGEFWGSKVVGITIGAVVAYFISKPLVARAKEEIWLDDEFDEKFAAFKDNVIAIAKPFRLSGEESEELISVINDVIKNIKLIECTDELPHANSIIKPIIVAIVSRRPKLPASLFVAD